MIDFTSLPRKKKTYGGINGGKLSIIYNNELYLLKLQTPPVDDPKVTYTNSCTSEYLGSHIFNLLGVKAHETLLGCFTYEGKSRTAIACKDFTTPTTIILDFASVENSIIEYKCDCSGIELPYILEAIHRQTIIDPKQLEKHFWDMFVIDAFIGNWDRHNGNWGFLYDQGKDIVEIAPIYDLGGSFIPQIDDESIKKIFSSKKEMLKRVYEIPNSSIQLNKERINYYKFINSLEYDGCNQALLRIVPRINLEEINKLIDEIEVFTPLQKQFHKEFLRLRKELILDEAFNRLSPQ